jgi:DNA (cytosine-5)-methyltransferase 1
MRELARLQTFPDDFVVKGSVSEAQRQIGNAVPSLLAEVLARAIARQLLGGHSQDDSPRLALPPAPPVPAAEVVAEVPVSYLRLRGEHEAHPGTGMGHRAKARHRLAVMAD